MTITEPLPVSGYGKADWVDYTNYWRELDAEWLMERTILRYADVASRQAQYANPKNGQITYNEVSDHAEMWSRIQGAWVPLQQYFNLVNTQDTVTGVSISHKNASGKGITFQPAQTLLDNPVLIMGGVLGVDATGVTIKTGAKTAKLTTDANSLVSDSPVSATALNAVGALSAASASISGTLSTTDMSLTGTLTGNGILNGASGTIGAVNLAGGTISGGQVIQNSGIFYGDSNGAVMRQRLSVTPFTLGAAYVQATATVVNLAGTTVSFVGQPSVASNRSMQYVTTAGTFNGGPVIVRTTDPGVANVPEGTIWIDT